MAEDRTSFARAHLSSAICHLPFGICHLSFILLAMPESVASSEPDGRRFRCDYFFA